MVTSPKSSQSCLGRAENCLDGFAAVTPAWPRQHCPVRPHRASFISTMTLSPSFLLRRPHLVKALYLAPSSISTSSKQNLGCLAGRTRPCIQRLMAVDPPPPQNRYPSRTRWPQPGNTVAPLTSSVMTLQVNPVKFVVPAREVLRNRPIRALLAVLAAMKVA